MLFGGFGALLGTSVVPKSNQKVLKLGLRTGLGGPAHTKPSEKWLGPSLLCMCWRHQTNNIHNRGAGRFRTGGGMVTTPTPLFWAWCWTRGVPHQLVWDTQGPAPPRPGTTVWVLSPPYPQHETAPRPDHGYYLSSGIQHVHNNEGPSQFSRCLV